jgi:hypothetical protein
MLPPNVKTVVKDEKLKITYVIWAYRKVTDFEASDSIASLHRTLAKKKQKLQPGQTYIIQTIYH